MKSLGQKGGSVLKTIGAKGLHFGLNVLGSKGNLGEALVKTAIQSIV